MTDRAAVILIAQVVSAGAIIEAAEILYTRAEYGPEGTYSWALLRTGNRWSLGPAAGFFDWLFSEGNFTRLVVVKLLFAIAVVAGLATPVLPAAIWVLFLLQIAVILRHQHGLDGADQLTSIVLASLALWCLAPTPLAKQVAIWFIAFQSVLSYFTAGIAKLISTEWRSGQAIRNIVNTRSYGSRFAVDILDRSPPYLNLVACWSVLLYECAFPLALLSPKLALVFFAVGATLHGGIAVCMGLNNFLWAFLATYPAVYLAAQNLSSYLGR